MSVDLRTKYLGLELKNPLVVAACPLTQSIDNLTLRSTARGGGPPALRGADHPRGGGVSRAQDFGTESFAESLTYFEPPSTGHARHLPRHDPRRQEGRFDADHRSLNGVLAGGWTEYARRIEEAGADALELNIYLIAADMNLSGAQIEEKYLELVAAVKQSLSIPLAVKVGPYFSSPGHMATRIAEAGADGLVLFNRFLQPDIDLDELRISPKLKLSNPYELLLPLRWVAILHGRVGASLALTSGIHSETGLIKALLAGADAGMVASVLYRRA